MRFRILLISFLLSLPFWWSMNILAYNLEDFYFWNKIAENPEIFMAQASADLDLLKIERERQDKNLEFLADNLEANTKAVLSLEIDSQGKEKILFERNSREILPIASLTKLMTALVILDFERNYNLPKALSISNKAISQEGTSKYGELKEGEFFSVETLLNVMLIESSNDVAYAFGELTGIDEFVELMNLYSEKIGLEDTHFINPTGLDPDEPGERGNVSSARDIAELAKYILENELKIFEITNKISYEVFDTEGKLHHFIPQNTNELLGEFPEIIGGKTGWNIGAGGCLVVVMENPEKNSHIINVILGADDRFEEMRKLIKLINY